MARRIPKQFYIDAEQNRALKELASKSGCSESAVARQALSRMFASEERYSRDDIDESIRELLGSRQAPAADDPSDT